MGHHGKFASRRLSSDLEKGYKLCPANAVFSAGHKLPDGDDLLIYGTSLCGEQIFHGVHEALGGVQANCTHASFLEVLEVARLQIFLKHLKRAVWSTGAQRLLTLFDLGLHIERSIQRTNVSRHVLASCHTSHTQQAAV